MSEKHVLLGFSGGLDSFAAAVLLKEAGYRVTAVHLALHDLSPESTKEDLYSLTQFLEVPLIIKDMQTSFRDTIVKPFAESYLAGRTPNPCVWCNERIKLSALAALLYEQDAQWIATGHYAKKEYDSRLQRWFVARGKDRSKDQSYFLSFVSQEHLKRLLLPLGDQKKNELKAAMERLGAPVTTRSESHDICFLSGTTFSEFISHWSQAQSSGKGKFISKNGRILGTHEGFYRFTVGQRRGIGIADKTPYYVTALYPERNQVEIGKVENLYKSIFLVTDCRWYLSPVASSFPALCQIRYRHTAAPATVKIMKDNQAKVSFVTPQRAITPGQVAAFYRENRLIGAGAIDTVKP